MWSRQRESDAVFLERMSLLRQNSILQAGTAWLHTLKGGEWTLSMYCEGINACGANLYQAYKME